MSRNQELFDRARGVIPGGVDSPVRAYGSVGGTPRFMVSAQGAYVTDADGRDYVDLVDTGRTLRENGLEAVEEIMPVSARLIVNQAALKTKRKELQPLIDAFAAAAVR